MQLRAESPVLHVGPEPLPSLEGHTCCRVPGKLGPSPNPSPWGRPQLASRLSGTTFSQEISHTCLPCLFTQQAQLSFLGASPVLAVARMETPHPWPPGPHSKQEPSW